MSNSFIFRTITKEDIPRVLEIYNFYIKNGFENFEEIEFKYLDFLNLVDKILDLNLPFLICEENKLILGFAYLNIFRNKSGYKYSFENSIYVDNKHIRKGIGYLLLKNLIKSSLKNPNIKNIIAVIVDKDSNASIKIHKKNGFKMIGTLKKIGFKKDKWLNTIYMQKIIDEKN